MKQIKKLFFDWVEEAFNEYGIVIASIVIGIVLGWQLKFLLSDRKYYKQIKIRLSEKDNRIAQLNFIVHERLNKVTVKEEDKAFFKKMKKYFKNFKIN